MGILHSHIRRGGLLLELISRRRRAEGQQYCADRDECDLKRRSAYAITLFVAHGSWQLSKPRRLHRRSLSAPRSPGIRFWGCFQTDLSGAPLVMPRTTLRQ